MNGRMQSNAHKHNTMKTIVSLLALLGFTSPIYGSTVSVAGPDNGILIVSFLFLMGVSQVGVVFCAICRLVYAQWAKPFFRLAELSTMAFAPFAIVGFLLILLTKKSSSIGCILQPKPTLAALPPLGSRVKDYCIEISTR